MSDEPRDLDHATRRIMRITLVGLGVNLVLACAKLLAGIFGHSYALVADAIESFSDILGSAMIHRAPCARQLAHNANVSGPSTKPAAEIIVRA